MELSHRFTVPVSIDAAWAAFNDLEQIAPCFPGAMLTSFDGERFEGRCKVKLGPISLQYTGTGRFLERDETARRAVIEAKGKDKRGNGTAAAAVSARLIATGDNATDVEVKTDLNITGRPAQFGRGLMQEVSDKLLAQFTACLETKLGSDSGRGEGGGEQTSPDVVSPRSAAELAAALPDAEADRRTPIAAESERAAKSSSRPPACTTAKVPPASLPRSQPVAAATPWPARDPRATQPELDLGATVLPLLLKRYAVHIVGALVVLWVLKKVLGRG
jgi:carbon monoxide dehydrogenase subunit G